MLSPYLEQNAENAGTRPWTAVFSSEFRCPPHALDVSCLNQRPRKVATDCTTDPRSRTPERPPRAPAHLNFPQRMFRNEMFQ